MLFESRLLFWKFTTLIFDTESIKNKNLVEEQDSRDDQNKAKKFLLRENLVAETRFEKEEEPYHEYSALLNNSTICRCRIFGDANTAAIKHGAEG